MKTVAPAVARLVLYLSREEIDASELEFAQSLCARIEDWRDVIDVAHRKFSSPLVYGHLTRLAPGTIPADALSEFRLHALGSTASSLYVIAEQRAFHENCIAPLDVPHVYLKGPSLAARYYENPAVRYCRDIDVLVGAQDFDRVIRHAMARDYRVFSATGTEVPKTDDQTLRALIRYSAVVALLSPGQTWVEVHRDVSKNTGIFQTPAMMNAREEVRFGDHKIGVLPTALLFCYLCYHNTRHTWSHLHWLSDLAAMVRHPSFDLQEVQDTADTLGLSATLSACLDFHDLAFGNAPWELASTNEHAAQLLQYCVRNLAGDLELERAIRSGDGLHSPRNRWMVSPKVRRRAMLRSAVARVSPNFENYTAWPLPDRMQWLYVIFRPVRRLKRFFGLGNVAGR